MNTVTELALQNLTLIKHLKEINSPFLHTIEEVYNEIKDILNSRVQHVFPNYTLHNIAHSFRVAEYMSKLVSDYRKLNELEIALLIYSALLHDIGMAVSEEDIELIKTDRFPFCEIKFSAMKNLTNGDEDIALQEFVRLIHSSLSAKYITGPIKERFAIPRLPTLDFSNELSMICESHTRDHDWIKANLRVNEIRGDYAFNSQFIAAVLRLADILDIDSNRTPYGLYKLISPKGISNEEWQQHFVISNNDKILFNEKTNHKKIVFHGKTKNASIHRKILVYIGWVESELEKTTSLVSGMQPQYGMMYETKPEVNIQTEGFSFSDYKMTLEFKAISSLLMGEKIYGNNTLGLRELIQNSIDSCKIRQEIENKSYEFGSDKYLPKIKVIIDEDKNQVIIKDNGTGMSVDIIKKHFLNIGVSYYTSGDFLLKDFSYQPIGNFGIGFLSCFMLSNNVRVETRHYKSKNKYTIELEKGNEYTSLTVSEDVCFEGTEVILNFSEFMHFFENSSKKVSDFLERYFLTDGITFELIEKKNEIIFPIKNSINYLEPLDRGLFKVDLKEYLGGFEGYTILKEKKAFVSNFEQIDFPDTLYSYTDENGLEKVSDYSSFQIDNYILDRKIQFLRIPIVENHVEDDFQNGMNFTDDDIDEVIDKLDHELNWISVIVPKELQNDLCEQEIEQNDAIFENFTFQDLVNLGHSEFCPTKIFVETKTFFEGKTNHLYLPYTSHFRSNGCFGGRQGRTELFIRGVLIKDFYFNIPTIASIFEIKTIVANITSKNFIPDISRNNIDASSKEDLNSILGRAIHFGACKTMSFAADEKETIRKFIDTFYVPNPSYEKSQA